MNRPRPNERTVKPCNEIGLIIESDCRLPEIKFYEESGTVYFFATVHDSDEKEQEALQYLSAQDAMKFAKAMEACAIRALKNAN